MPKEKICSLIAEAIKDEAGAPKLYNRLLDSIKDPVDRQIIQDIIEHEKRHKNSFDRMFKKYRCKGKINKSAKKRNHSCIPVAIPLQSK